MHCIKPTISLGCLRDRGFADKVTEHLYHGKNSKMLVVFKINWQTVQRKLDLLNRADSLRDLRVPPNNRLEKLRGDLEGLHSIRVNDQIGLDSDSAMGTRATSRSSTITRKER